VALLAVLILGLIGFALWKGMLKSAQLPPILLGIAGAFLAARGSLLIGVIAIAIAATWYRGMSWRMLKNAKLPADTDALEQARLVLGVSRFDNAASIREKHRALMAEHHPDVGGEDDHARELNAARDLLLNEMDQKGR